VATPHDPLQAYLDQALGPEDRSGFEAHLLSCRDCSSLVDADRRLSQAVRQGAERLLEPPPAAEVQRLMRKVAQRSAPSRRVKAVGWALAGACACAAAAIAWQWSRPPQLLPIFTVAANGDERPLSGDGQGPAEGWSGVLRVGGDRLGVAPRTSLQLVQHDRAGVRLKLARGAVAAAVSKKQLGQVFEVEAGRYTVSVVGTRFRVRSDGDVLNVDVAEGRVRVGSRSGDTWEVNAGQSLQVEASQGRLGNWAGADFPELSASPPPPGEDAGAAPTTQAPEAAAPPVALSIPPDAIARWRHAPAAGKCHEVVAEIRRALRVHPAQREGWRELADCLRVLGEHAQAAAAYRDVIAHAAPADAEGARLFLAELLQDRLGDPAGAERELRAFLQRSQPPLLEASTRVKLARALLSQGKSAPARAELRRVIQRFPSSPPALEALDLLKRAP